MFQRTSSAFVCFALITLCLLPTWSPARAEQLTVFTCKKDRVPISRYAIDARVEGEPKEILLTTFKVGKQVGVLDTGDRSFERVCQDSQKSMIPRFMGSGWKYLLKSDTSVWYVVFFEYVEFSPMYDGKMLSYGKLSDLGSGGATFVGSFYDGRGKDPTLLKQLKAITERILKEETKEERLERLKE